MKYSSGFILFLFLLSCKIAVRSDASQELTGIWDGKIIDTDWISSVIKIPNKIHPMIVPSEMISVPQYLTDSFQLVFNDNFEYEYKSPAYELNYQGKYQIKNDKISLIWMDGTWLDIEINNLQKNTLFLTINRAKMLIPERDSSTILIARGIKLHLSKQ